MKCRFAVLCSFRIKPDKLFKRYPLFSYTFRRVRRIVKATVRVVLSVRPSAWNKWVATRGILIKSYIWGFFFLKFVEKI